MKEFLVDISNSNDLMINMMLNNKIECLVDFSMEKNIIRYNLEGLVTPKEKYIEKISYEDIFDVLAQSLEIISYMENYLISIEQIDFSMKNIFFDELGIIKIVLDPFRDEVSSLNELFYQLFGNFKLQVDGHAQELLTLYNFFKQDSPNLERLGEMLEIKNLEVNTVATKELVFDRENNLDIINDGNKKVSEKKDKKSYLDKIFGVFSKKEYKLKSLNLDIRIPKK
ncbi:MAG: hypothetical protein GXZ08_02200 [Tissierellia bacterium]|nr:hypothetical protein [Tissierellia bacterium]